MFSPNEPLDPFLPLSNIAEIENSPDSYSYYRIALSNTEHEAGRKGEEKRNGDEEKELIKWNSEN